MVDKPFSSEDRVSITCMLLNQIVLNSSEYTQNTYYPLIFAIQALIQETFSLLVYRQMVNLTSGEITNEKVCHSHSERIFRASGATGQFLSSNEIECQPHLKINDICGIERKQGKDGEFIIGYFYVLYAIRDSKITPLDMRDFSRRLVEQFFIKINRSSNYGERVRGWLLRLHKNWKDIFFTAHQRFRKNHRMASQFGIESWDKELFQQLQFDKDYLLHDIFNGLIRANQGTSIVGGQIHQDDTKLKEDGEVTEALTQSTNLLFISKRYDFEHREKGRFCAVGQYHIGRNQLEEFVKISQKRDNSNGSTLDIDQKVQKLLSLNPIAANPFVRECFECGNVISVDLVGKISEYEFAIYSLIAGSDDFSLVYVPVWLSGAPAFIIVFVIPKSISEKGDVWAHQFVLLSEMAKSNLSRRIRARTRERYAERIYYIATAAWRPVFSSDNFLTEPSDVAKKEFFGSIERFNKYLDWLSFLMPFDAMQIIPIFHNDESSTLDLENAHWVATFGEISLFIKERPGAGIFNRKFGDVPDFISKRGRNSIRRAFRDLRFSRIDRVIDKKTQSGEKNRVFLQIVSEYVARELVKSPTKTVVLFVPYSERGPYHMRSDIAFGIIRGVVPFGDLVRIYAPFLSPSEWVRAAHHYQLDAKENLVDVVANMHRADGVIVFYDKISSITTNNHPKILERDAEVFLEKIRMTSLSEWAPAVTVILAEEENFALDTAQSLDSIYIDLVDWYEKMDKVNKLR